MILSAASTYFRSFFMKARSNMQQHQVIFLKDVEAFEMEYLLQFIYLGHNSICIVFGPESVPEHVPGHVGSF